MSLNQDQRRDKFKGNSHFKPEELRRRREKAHVEIRKQKREENLSKRRNFNLQQFGPDSDDETDPVAQEAEVNNTSFFIYRDLYIYIYYRL